ncbi:MAG: hypothetical protein AB7F35_13260 [Acetobacteraceae bacterium]
MVDIDIPRIKVKLPSLHLDTEQLLSKLNLDKLDGLDTEVGGQTISAWTQEWLRWAMQAPADDNPLSSTSYAATHDGNTMGVFFLAGGGWTDAEIADVPANTPILLPMINAWDIEGPGTGTLQHPSGDWAQDAATVTRLALDSIQSTRFSLVKLNDGLSAHTSGSSTSMSSLRTVSGVSDLFALGEPQPGSLIESLVGTSLEPSIQDLPYSMIAGKWVMIGGLSPGDYRVEFGGHGQPVLDPTADPGEARYIIGDEQGWGTVTSDILHVVAQTP